MICVIVLLHCNTHRKCIKYETCAKLHRFNVLYCKSGNFRDNFIFTNSVKRHIYDVKSLQLGHDKPIAGND